MLRMLCHLALYVAFAETVFTNLAPHFMLMAGVNESHLRAVIWVLFTCTFRTHHGA